MTDVRRASLPEPITCQSRPSVVEQIRVASVVRHRRTSLRHHPSPCLSGNGRRLGVYAGVSRHPPSSAHWGRLTHPRGQEAIRDGLTPPRPAGRPSRACSSAPAAGSPMRSYARPLSRGASPPVRTTTPPMTSRALPVHRRAAADTPLGGAPAASNVSPFDDRVAAPPDRVSDSRSRYAERLTLCSGRTRCYRHACS